MRRGLRRRASHPPRHSQCGQLVVRTVALFTAAANRDQHEAGPQLITSVPKAHLANSHFDIAKLMQALHAAAASTRVMMAADIKIRAVSYNDYLVAGVRDGFCHVSVYMLEGRTERQKLAVSERLRATLSELFPTTKSLSVDIRDMDSSAYKKAANSKLGRAPLRCKRLVGRPAPDEADQYMTPRLMS